MSEKTYIILLNYKGWKDTIECLESIFKIKQLNFQVIVIDNSPTNDSIDHIEKWAIGAKENTINTQFDSLIYPLVDKPISYISISEDTSRNKFYDESLLVIKSKENRGFAAGNNIGLDYIIRRGDFQFCWLLNNDTIVPKDSLKNQIDYFAECTSDIGIIGSVVVDYFDPTKIQALGGGILNTTTFLTYHLGENCNLNDIKESIKNESIDYVLGASMFVKKEFLMDVGILSEDYFLYFEELDWTYRAKEKKWNIDWCPDAIIYHKEGKSIGTSKNYKKRSFLSEIEFFKSRKVFFTKYFENRVFFNFYSVLLILNRLRRFQFKLAINFIKILVFNKT